MRRPTTPAPHSATDLDMTFSDVIPGEPISGGPTSIRAFSDSDGDTYDRIANIAPVRERVEMPERNGMPMAYFAQNDMTCLLACEDAQQMEVGVLRLEQRDPLSGACEVEISLAIHPNFQRLGHGARAARLVVNRLRELRWCDAVRVRVAPDSDHALAVVQSLGFRFCCNEGPADRYVLPIQPSFFQ